MTRETRANLVFLTAFLALSLPGAVILFRKKLDPNAPKMFQPDAVATRAPYMAPGVVGEVKYVVPPGVQAWVEGLVRARTGESRVIQVDGRPVMSVDRQAQVVAVKRGGGAIDIYVIAWDGEDAARAHDVAAVLKSKGTEVEGERLTAETVPVPEEVRRELRNFGLTRSPSEVGWVQHRFPPESITAAAPGDLLLRFGEARERVFVNLFTR